MKYLIVLTWLSLYFSINAQDTLFKADKIGKSEFKQLVSGDRIYPVVKEVNESYFELLPSDYFHMNYRYDTLKIALKSRYDKLELVCMNCMYMDLGLKDSAVFFIKSGDSQIEFDWQLMKKPLGGSGPPLKKTQKLDEKFGYVKLGTRSIHYAQIQKEPELYLGFIDCNFNGSVDSLDYVSLSNSTYFPTVRNQRVDFVKDIDTIVTDWWKASFQLLNSEGDFVLRRVNDAVQTPSVLFSSKIDNFQIDSIIDLISFLEKSPKRFTVVTFWNEFCPDCVTELDSLEIVQKQFQVLTFYNRDNLNDLLEKGKWTFKTYLSSQIAEGNFLLNGMPCYWVLDKQRNCLYKTRNWSELKTYLSKLSESEQ